MDFLKFLAKYYLYAILACSTFYIGFNVPYWIGASNTELVIQIVEH